MLSTCSFFFSSRRRHTRSLCDWSSDVCSSDLGRSVSEKKPQPTAYGGQAVIEGVMIRGRRTVALACRRPNGDIYRYREPLRSRSEERRVGKERRLRWACECARDIYHVCQERGN